MDKLAGGRCIRAIRNAGDALAKIDDFEKDITLKGASVYGLYVAGRVLFRFGQAFDG